MLQAEPEGFKERLFSIRRHLVLCRQRDQLFAAIGGKDVESQLRGHKPRIASGSAADLQNAAFRGQPLQLQSMQKRRIRGFVAGKKAG